MTKESRFMLMDTLNSLIDQAKFIRNYIRPDGSGDELIIAELETLITMTKFIEKIPK